MNKSFSHSIAVACLAAVWFFGALASTLPQGQALGISHLHTFGFSKQQAKVVLWFGIAFDAALCFYCIKQWLLPGKRPNRRFHQ